MRKEFVNRGVLFGPYLPIYGFGMLILIFLLSKYKSNKHLLKDSLNGSISVITLVSFLYITIIEYTSADKIYRIDTFWKDYGIGFLIFMGIGLLVRYLFIHKIKNKKLANLDITPLVVFFFIFVLTTIIEFISHYVMDVYFHTILWDYSQDFLNLNARVNFDASRNFAIGGTALLYLMEPVITKVTNSKRKEINVITIMIAILMFIDILFSFVFS